MEDLFEEAFELPRQTFTVPVRGVNYSMTPNRLGMSRFSRSGAVNVYVTVEGNGRVGSFRSHIGAEVLADPEAYAVRLLDGLMLVIDGVPGQREYF